MSRDARLATLTCLFISVVTFLSLHVHGPPEVLPADASPAAFSAVRALEHVTTVAQRPRPVGSAANAEVRAYLLRELTALGLSPHVQATTATRGFHVAEVHNVLVRIEGTASTKAILLSAHYDTVPTSPGAADDGSGVATLLETLRALTAGPPVKNDVIALFTSPEETGWHGAIGFLTDHPWAKDIGLVLNFDVSGNTGPSYLVSTSPNNGRLIREFARAAPHPFAASMAVALHHIGTGGTSDFKYFRQAGLPGLEFGFFEGKAHYDTPLDRIQDLDRRSLQHQGSYALALTRHFGDLPLDDPQAADAVYFSLFGRVLVHYPEAWALPLAIAVGLLLAAVLWLGMKRRHLTLSGIGLGLLVFLVSSVGAPLVVWSAWWIIRELHPVYAWPLHGRAYNDTLFLISFVGLAVASTTALFGLAQRRLGVGNLAAGVLLGMLASMGVTSVLLPSCSYLVTWPLFFGLLALGGWFYAGNQGHTILPTRQILLLLACALPVVALLVPTVYASFMGLRTDDAPLVMAIMVVLLGSLVPHLDLMARPIRWVVPAGSLVIAVGSLGAALVGGGFDAERPQTTGLFYAVNADADAAYWITDALTRDRPNEWEAQFFPAGAERRPIPEFIPGSPFPHFVSTAPRVPVEAPRARVLEQGISGDTRTVRIHIDSPRRAQRMSVVAEPATQFLSVVVDGRVLDGRSPGLTLVYDGFPSDGTDLLVTVPASHPVRLVLIDHSYGLPDRPGMLAEPLPAHVIPHGPWANTTLVRKAYDL